RAMRSASRETAASRASVFRHSFCIVGEGLGRIVFLLESALREAHRHLCAPSGLAVEHHIAAVQIHEAFHEREPEPGAPVLSALTHTLETVENALLLLFRDAHALVLD